jgi:hypothetical protein
MTKPERRNAMLADRRSIHNLAADIGAERRLAVELMRAAVLQEVAEPILRAARGQDDTAILRSDFDARAVA